MIRLQITTAFSDELALQPDGAGDLRRGVAWEDTMLSLARALFQQHVLDVVEFQHRDRGVTDLQMLSFALSKDETDAIRTFFVGMMAEPENAADHAKKLYAVLERETDRMAKEAKEMQR